MGWQLSSNHKPMSAFGPSRLADLRNGRVASRPLDTCWVKAQDDFWPGTLVALLTSLRQQIREAWE